MHLCLFSAHISRLPISSLPSAVRDVKPMVRIAFEKRRFHLLCAGLS